MSQLARAISEKDFQRQVLDLAKIFGWKVYHPMLSKWSERGFPDLTMVRPPRVIFAELKTARGRRSIHQDEWAELLLVSPAVEYHLWRPDNIDMIATVLA